MKLKHKLNSFPTTRSCTCLKCFLSFYQRVFWIAMCLISLHFEGVSFLFHSTCWWLTSAPLKHLSPPQKPRCFVARVGTQKKRKRADHDALATFSIIVIFNGLPSGSLCGGEKWSVVSSDRKVFLATFALDKVDQYEGNPRQSLNSGSTPWIPDSLSLELGFRIPIVSGIPDSLSCTPDSKAQKTWFHSKTLLDSESHKRKSHRFRNLNSLT